jgi:hypothetical protein
MSDREIRTGAHLLAAAKSLGWKDDGEGAFEFVVRRSREVALEDCAARIEALEAALHKIDDITIDHTAMGIARKALASAALAPEQDKDTSVEDTIEGIKEKHRK